MAISKGMPMITTSKTMLGHMSHIGRPPKMPLLLRAVLTTTVVAGVASGIGCCMDIGVTSKGHETRARARVSPLHAGVHCSVQLALNLLVGLVKQWLDVRRIIAVGRHLIGQLGTHASQCDFKWPPYTRKGGGTGSCLCLDKGSRLRILACQRVRGLHVDRQITEGLGPLNLVLLIGD